MVKGHESELDKEEVESMIGHEVIMEIPHHEKVEEALSVKKPIVHHKPDHHVSERFKGVAADVAGIRYEPDLREPGFLDKLLDRFT
jgi:MinD-like ATPase involved in chromosome partitioning or flagellar assembly